MNKRELEEGLAQRPAGKVNYVGFPGLNQLWAAQHPLTKPVHHAAAAL